jgi:hypothetical protein
MKTKKILAKATEYKSKGYVYMAAIVKSHFNTSYFNVVKIDDILKIGKWIPANFVSFPSGAYGRYGVNGKKIDWSITARK